MSDDSARGGMAPGMGGEVARGVNEMKKDSNSGGAAGAFSKDGAIGKQFEADGAIGGTAQAVGGPFSKDGMVGKHFTSEGAVGGNVDAAAKKAS